MLWAAVQSTLYRGECPSSADDIDSEVEGRRRKDRAVGIIDASRTNPFFFWLAQDPLSSDKSAGVAGPFSYDGNRISEVDGSRPAYLQQKFGLGPDDVPKWIRSRAHGGNFPPGENVWRNAELVECRLKPDQRYARIARPFGYLSESRTPGLKGGIAHELHRSAAQLFSLCERLSRLFENVHPHPDNFAAYGLEARNIILLAATEVEVQFRAVATANGLAESRPTMRHLATLFGPMYLDAYSTQFSQFPWIPPIAPFATWNNEKPGQSLAWYNAYNSVKHDRESNFAESTLLSAMTAVSACHVTLCAQFGDEQLHRTRPDLGLHLDMRRTMKPYSLSEQNARGVYVTSGWPAGVETLKLFAGGSPD